MSTARKALPRAPTPTPAPVTASHPTRSRVPVNLDHSRSDAGQPRESYPDICFAVDSSDHALRSQVCAAGHGEQLGAEELV